MERHYSSMGGMSTETDINEFIKYTQKRGYFSNMTCGGNPEIRKEDIQNELMLYKDLLNKVSNAMFRESYMSTIHWLDNCEIMIERGDMEKAEFCYKKSVEIALTAIESRNMYTTNEGASDMFHVGDVVRIIHVDDQGGKDYQASRLNGKSGMIEHIDDAGQLHGTWGSIALIPELDEIEIVNNTPLTESYKVISENYEMI